MCLNHVANYWHFHEFYNHMLCKWVEKSSVTEFFRKPGPLFQAVMKIRPEKKKCFPNFPCSLLRVLLQNKIGHSLLFFVCVCMCVCVFIKSSTSNQFANGMLPSYPQALFKHIHLTMSGSNHSRGIYVYQSWQWAGTRSEICSREIMQLSRLMLV